MKVDGMFHPSAREELERVLEGLRAMPGFAPGLRVVAAMSGGVDSSVMAALLHLAGYQVVGISMRLFEKSDPNEGSAKGRCCTLDDFQDARRVAHRMGFDHYVMDFGEQFKRDVMEPFVASYLAGETPSPCILCNKHMKFDALFLAANELDVRFVATGHYAKIKRDDLGFHLFKGTDPTKDQSYFLFPHTQSTLSRTLFPLESLPKTTVRRIAEHLGLGLGKKAESQEICFIPDDRYDRFIEESGAVPCAASGPIRHVRTGASLGVHQGYWRYTIGQRRGVGVAYAYPLYVIRTDPRTNTVWVGEDEDLFGGELVARDVSWCLAQPSNLLSCHAKLRSRSPEVPAIVEPLSSGQVRVRFSTPQRAITPGQAIVFYDRDELLGGGWIDQVPRESNL